jgi:hypothetical protein
MYSVSMDSRDSSRLADALIHATQILGETNERIAQAGNKAQEESTKIQRQLMWLTVALAFAGFAQALAAGWPFFAWWLAHTF